MTLKATTRETFCRLILRDFSTNDISYCFIRSKLSIPIKFFLSVTLGTLASVTAKCTPNDEMTHVISVSTSISGVSLAYHIPETGTVTCLFFCIFRNRHR